jgi:predicted DNA-binding ribbon-helix-helix protein
LREIAVARDMTPSHLVATINSYRHHGNLSSAIRQFVLGVYRDQISDHQGETRERLVASSR